MPTLLEHLKDDPELYVRRSVANNLNDIGKDHPDRLLDTARRWLAQAGAQRRWVVQRALRSLVKQCDPKALALLGYRQMTTRTHHPGRHAVHALVNGVSHRIGHFDVIA